MQFSVKHQTPHRPKQRDIPSTFFFAVQHSIPKAILFHNNIFRESLRPRVTVSRKKVNDLRCFFFFVSLSVFRCSMYTRGSERLYIIYSSKTYNIQVLHDMFLFSGNCSLRSDCVPAVPETFQRCQTRGISLPDRFVFRASKPVKTGKNDIDIDTELNTGISNRNRNRTK